VKTFALVAAAALTLTCGAAPASATTTILFVGNSFTYGEPAGASAPTVQGYQPGTVTDLNRTNVGGVPALFKQFTVALGLDYEVSLETVGGTGLDYHYTQKLGLLNRPWDKVVLQSYSTLDATNPGNSDRLVAYSNLLATAFHDQNPDVDVYLTATWSRADLTYRTRSPWLGKPIDAMEKDVEAGYRRAATSSAYIDDDVITVGAAWTRAMTDGLADANPYDGITPGQINLWAPEGYHASTYGYYLSALMQFGAVTGKDPRLLGADEAAAASFNFTREQTTALQAVAARTLGLDVAAVPEPTSWGLMLVGFGVVGAGLRSRRRSVVFAAA